MTNVFTEIPTTEPQKFIAGDSLTWKRTDLNSDYSNALYTLTYSARLENGGTTEIAITATTSGDFYLVSESAATTAAYTVGVYHWQAYITRDSDSARATIDSGTFEIIADRANATTDPRNHTKITLDNIQAVIENRATLDQMSYSIAGRSLSRMTIDDLLKFRDRYKAEWKKEQNAEAIANGKGSSRLIKVRFS
jgi:hypothetical protein